MQVKAGEWEQGGEPIVVIVKPQMLALGQSSNVIYSGTGAGLQKKFILFDICSHFQG